MKLRILEFGEVRMSPNKIWAGLSAVTELATAGSNVPQGIVKLQEVGPNQTTPLTNIDNVVMICGIARGSGNAGIGIGNANFTGVLMERTFEFRDYMEHQAYVTNRGSIVAFVMQNRIFVIGAYQDIYNQTYFFIVNGEPGATVNLITGVGAYINVYGFA